MYFMQQPLCSKKQHRRLRCQTEISCSQIRVGKQDPMTYHLNRWLGSCVTLLLRDSAMRQTSCSAITFWLIIRLLALHE